MKAQGFVLRCQPHSESSVIFNVVSNEGNYLSFIGKGIKKSRDKKMALLQPMQEIILTYYPSKKSELHLIKEIQAAGTLTFVNRSVVQNCFAQFAAEFIGRYAKQLPDYSDAYDLSVWAVDQISKEAKMDFPIQFLHRLMVSLGIQANSAHILSVVVQESDLSNFEKYSGKKYDDKKVKIALSNFYHFLQDPLNSIEVGERATILGVFLCLIQNQMPGFNEVKSIDVIREVLRS